MEIVYNKLNDDEPVTKPKGYVKPLAILKYELQLFNSSLKKHDKAIKEIQKTFPGWLPSIHFKI